MNEVLKQRLVGALILVALGVIFWPIIFVQPEDSATLEPRTIPEAPRIDAVPIEAPGSEKMRAPPELSDFPQDVDAQEVVDDVIEETAPEPDAEPAPENAEQSVESPGERATRSEPPPKLAMDNEGVPKAWTLQVATLSSEEKADVLRRRLLDLKHQAYVARVQRNGKTLYRVCVGPKVERAELEKLKPMIDSSFGVKSLIARYVP